MEIQLIKGKPFAKIDVKGLFKSVVPKEQGYISREEANEVIKFLELPKNLSEYELRAVRNSIVKFYADQSDRLRDTNREEFWKIQDQMSAFVAVIDDLIFDVKDLNDMEGEPTFEDVFKNAHDKEFEFNQALDILRFGSSKEDQEEYQEAINFFDKSNTLQEFVDYAMKQGFKPSDLRSEKVMEGFEETPFIIYAKAKNQNKFKAMDMEEGIQVSNLIRATLIYEPEEKLKNYIQQLKKDNPDWDFKYQKA